MVTYAKGAGGRAIPQVIDGIRFASKAEGRRYLELKLLARAGEITHLECHPKFEFVIGKLPLKDRTTNRKITYSADFAYRQRHGFTRIVEDVKGFKKGKPIQTPEYRIKKALMWAVHGIEVIEVDA